MTAEVFLKYLPSLLQNNIIYMMIFNHVTETVWKTSSNTHFTIATKYLSCRCFMSTTLCTVVVTNKILLLLVLNSYNRKAQFLPDHLTRDYFHYK